MKKITALVLSLVMIISLAACGQQSNTPASTPSTPENNSEASTESEKELDFPKRPITIIVAWAPGGGDDTCARKIQTLAAEKYGVNIVVENVTGGSSAVAVTQVLNSAADGYTIAQVPFAYWGLVAQGQVDKGTEAFDFLSMVYEEPMCIYAKKDGRIKTLDDVFAAYEDGSLRFGRSGSVGSSYCYYNMLQDKAGVSFNPISYEGSSRTITEILGDNCDIGLGGTSDIMSMVNEGTMTPIVTFTKERVSVCPDTPTILEEGYDVFDYGEIRAMSILCTPKGLDPEVKEFLQNMFNEICASPEYQEYTDSQAMSPATLNEAELKQKADSVVECVTEVLKKYPVN